MPCYNCAVPFSFFNREKGCGNCGFGFCSSCLKFKVNVRSDDRKATTVCGACFALLTNSSKPAVRPPPDALLKRLETLDNFEPPRDPITVYKDQNSRLNRLKRGMSTEDRAIAERLEKLQKERKASMNIPSEDEMHERLAKLKGHPQGTSSAAENRNLLLDTDKRSDVEKTRDLLDKAKDEVVIDSHVLKPEDDIAMRLAKLKGVDPLPRQPPVDAAAFAPQGQTDPGEDADDLGKVLSEISMDAEAKASKALSEYLKDEELQRKVKKYSSGGGEQENDDMSEDDGEEEADRIVDSVLAEARLEDQLDKDVEMKEEKGAAAATTMVGSQKRLLRQIDRGIRSVEHEDEELPWCSICNEDAKVRCEGCDGDLYCLPCLKECHDEVELTDHKVVPYKPKPKGT